MATFSKAIFSSSTDGLPISVTQTVTAGNLIHTCSTSTSVLEEIWLYATNTSASNVVLTVEWGNATTSNNIKYTVNASNGLYLITPGLIIKGNATPYTVRAFAATTAVISITGYVNRIS
jgi:hypothetical protein